MKDFEKRIEKLEKHAKVNTENPYATWIFVCSSDEAGPSDEETDRFKEAYVARYGESRSPVIVNAFNGRMSASSVAVEYEYKPYQGSHPKPFRGVYPVNKG